MNQNLQAYHLITALLNAWEAEGYALGVDSQLLLRELLQKLPDEIELKDLKTKLTPVLANTREEQVLFYELFDKKLLETEAFFKENPLSATSNPNESSPSVWQRLWKEWRSELAVGLAILGMIWLLKNVFTATPNIPKEDIYIPVYVNLLDKNEQHICIDSSNFIEGVIRNIQKITVSDSTFFYSVKSIDKITPDSVIKNVELRTFLQDGKACIYFKGLAVGQDTVRYKICLSNKDSCSAANYVFIVTQPQTTEKRAANNEHLEYKNYDHSPDISNLIPTDKMRFGWQFSYWDWAKTFIWLFFIAIILILTKLFKKKHELVLKDLKGNTKAPYAWSIQVEGAEKVALNDAFYSASNQLRRRSDSEFQRLNMNKTVLATIRQGGRINFQYRYQTQANEYLILIDRQSAANHRAQVFNLLYKAFSENEVLD